MSEKNFNFKDMVEYVKLHTALTSSEAERAIEACFNCISEKLNEDYKVQLKNIGYLYRHYLPERNARNPRTGETFVAPPRFKAKFKSSSRLEKYLNNELKEDDADEAVEE